jgi:hypothetical protein
LGQPWQGRLSWRGPFPVQNRSDPILRNMDYEGRFLTIEENHFDLLSFCQRAQETMPILM